MQNSQSFVQIKVASSINECFTKSTVTQTFTNTSESPIELKITLFKNVQFLFDSFEASLDGKKVKSKVIERTKAEQKYTDAISSGNAAIFVAEKYDDKNKFFINLCNVPSGSKVVFTSHFLGYTQSNNGKYEAELMRNFPIFSDKSNSIFGMKDIEVEVDIRTEGKLLILCMKKTERFRFWKVNTLIKVINLLIVLNINKYSWIHWRIFHILKIIF